jgi:hypothetical protein
MISEAVTGQGIVWLKVDSVQAQCEVPMILWTPLRHNQPKKVSDEDAAKEVHIGV